MKGGPAGFVSFCRVVRADLTDEVVFYSPEGLGSASGDARPRHRGSSEPSLSRHNEGTELGAGVMWDNDRS